MNYDDHQSVIDCLEKDQEAEYDLREAIDEEIAFIHHPQGQWEPEIYSEFDGRPRYTFDQCKPAINDVWAEMAANEYAASTQPAGGGASDEVSKIIDGLIRNIYNISCFDDVSTKAGKRMIATGFSAWRLVSKYASDTTFFQDMMVIPIGNAHRRVWFDCSSELQTREDAMHVHVLSNMMSASADKKFKRPVQSVDDKQSADTYTYKPSDNVIVGEILYKKSKTKTIYLMEDDGVYDDEGLAKSGLSSDQAIDSREAEYFQVCSRKYDAIGWLEDEKETVWGLLPVIPEYSNFDVSEDGKVTYEGLIRSIMDACRVYNYSESRKVEESVLAARKKIFVDNRVAAGYEEELGNLNRDPRAVQLFNGKAADEAKVPIYETGGPAPNPAVSEVSDSMLRNMQLSLGLPNKVEIAAKTAGDSDFRAAERNSMGQVGTFEYYRAHKVALEHTAKVMLDALPRVYDTARKIRVIDEANQSSEVSINQPDETGQMMNDFSAGKYDVTLTIGKDFQSRQADANSSILELGQINPNVVMRNTDIIASNINAPGMSTVADRERAFLFKAGEIPQDQWTDKEAEQMQAQQAAQQNTPPDPATLIAEAEKETAQAKAQETQFKALEAQAKLELQQSKQQAEAEAKSIELQLKNQEAQIKELTELIKGAKMLAEIDNLSAESPALTAQEQIINENQEDIT